MRVINYKLIARSFETSAIIRSIEGDEKTKILQNKILNFFQIWFSINP